jgi:hypothetical protein
MTTLKKRLEELCAEAGKPIPYGINVERISQTIIAELNRLEMYSDIKKTKEVIMVNNYPAVALPVIDDVIKKYLSNQLKLHPKKQKSFNYDIPAHKVEAFEKALEMCGIEVKRNYIKNEKAQYVIPIKPSQLIVLGKTFQKERYNQEYRERKANREKMIVKVRPHTAV